MMRLAWCGERSVVLDWGGKLAGELREGARGAMGCCSGTSSSVEAHHDGDPGSAGKTHAPFGPGVLVGTAREPYQRSRTALLHGHARPAIAADATSGETFPATVSGIMSRL